MFSPLLLHTPWAPPLVSPLLFAGEHHSFQLRQQNELYCLFPSFHLICCSPFRFFNLCVKCLLHLYLLCVKIARKVFLLPGFILVHTFSPFLFPLHCVFFSFYCGILLILVYTWTFPSSCSTSEEKWVLHLSVSRWFVHSWASVTSKFLIIMLSSLILKSLLLNHCCSCLLAVELLSMFN